MVMANFNELNKIDNVVMKVIHLHSSSLHHLSFQPPHLPPLHADDRSSSIIHVDCFFEKKNVTNGRQKNLFYRDSEECERENNASRLAGNSDELRSKNHPPSLLLEERCKAAREQEAVGEGPAGHLVAIGGIRV
jgi:hypothetical protein